MRRTRLGGEQGGGEDETGDNGAIFAAAVASSALRLNRISQPEKITSRLRRNDPSLSRLKLYGEPSLFFDTFSEFLGALEGNTAVTAVELNWRFIGALSEVRRVLLMKQIGDLPAIAEIQLEGIGPSVALAVAVRQCGIKLKKLLVGSLRVNTPADLDELADAFSKLKSLQRLSISNVRLKVEAHLRLQEGVLRLEEDPEEGRPRISLDPLLQAIAAIPTLTKLQLQLQLDSCKFARLEDGTIQALCQAPRTLLVLDSCRLDDRHCFALAQSLIGNNSLQSLVVTRNDGIGQQGWNSLAAMLENNHVIAHLFTAPHHGSSLPLEPAFAPDRACRASMDLYLKLNQAGRSKLFGGHGVSHKDWVDFLVRENNDPDIIFYIIRANPSMCLV